MNPQKAFDFAQDFDPSEFIATPAPPSPLQQELTRRDANTWLILARLRQGEATNGELAAIGGLRYGGRIDDLRKKHGCVIETIKGERGKFTYRLTSEPNKQRTA